MQILDHKKIQQKIKRISYEILEHSYGSKKIILLGINNNGLRFAQVIKDQLASIFEEEILLGNLQLNPAKPNHDKVSVDIEAKMLKNAHVIIVDDVANTGRTIFYAYKALLDHLMKKVEVAVLVDRKHKAFPVAVNYVGLTLATTVKENIVVNLDKPSKYSVTLE